MKNPVGIISMQFVRPFTMGDLGLFEHARKLGFDFVELLVPEREDGLDLAAVRAAADAAGQFIVLAARVNAGRSIASLDADARRGGEEYLRYTFEVANALGARIVGGPVYGEPLVFSGRAPQAMSAEQMRRRRDHCVEGLSRLAPLASAAGVVMALEPLNRFETDMISTTRQAVEVASLVDQPGLGLLLDTFHMNMEERSIADAIREAGSWLVHFQANENHRGFPGTGHIDWTAVMRALFDVGYNGPVSLEPFRRNDDRAGLPIAFWRPPEEDEGDRLRAAASFVRSQLTMAEYRQ
ncbi:MAG: sugar phosphate isomerase/epimerase [Geminicoccaceae bacterium]|nr:sugar phosphate isomerase/epimerase [Geminicoccaceae bacterium]MCB9946022.1 sugar phosphate isomerase/epimerase [Geminicoccaceae bacterium]